MAKKKKTEDNIEVNEELNFMEYGVNPEDFLDITSRAEKSNLSALSKRFKLIEDSFSSIDSSIVSIMVSFDLIIDKIDNGISLCKKEIKKIKENLSTLDNSLMEIVWHLDNIIEDVENGILFQNDCIIAQEKIISIIELFSDLESLYDNIRLSIEKMEIKESLKKELKVKIYAMIETCDRFYFVFKNINEVKNNLIK